MNYLTSRDILAVIARVLHTDQPGTVVRDAGLLESGLARPGTYAFGTEVYPDLHTKAAALLHSLVRNHALIDGNKRVGWIATALFYRYNHHDLAAPTEDEGEAFVLDIATGTADDVSKIAETLSRWTREL